ncbi:MAG TPA: glutaredoxin family protein [Chloroflexota bacterium]|nr:glutaredoxin family protein [Chloroflexota bacterium]
MFPFRRRVRQITLYGKPGCHLCEDARALLANLARRYPMNVTEIDIRGDPALFREYDIRIPVIVIDGDRELEAPIDGKRLRDALR